MKIVIDFDSDGIELRIDKLIEPIKKWLDKNGDSLGHILAIFHFIISAVLLTLVIVSHTIYPSIWLKIIVFISLGLIWIQHLIFDACVVTWWEKSLTQTHSPFHRILENLLNIINLTLSDYNRHLVVIEGVALACFGLEIISYFTSLYLS